MAGNKLVQRCVVVGVGGIGKFLLAALARFLAYDDKRQWTLVLIDGDEYEIKNRTRQAFRRLGNKAKVTAEELREQFSELLVEAVPAYVSSVEQAAHVDHAGMTVMVSEVVHEGDWVFSCVDNHATRRLLSQHAQTLQNIRLFGGGNAFSDGNVQVYARRNGRDIFPPLEAAHPEIERPADKAPFEMSCEELASAGSPQLIFANQMAAALMCAAFYAETERKLRCEEVYFDLAATSLGGPAARPITRKK